jgi:hypothetical protein
LKEYTDIGIALLNRGHFEFVARYFGGLPLTKSSTRFFTGETIEKGECKANVFAVLLKMWLRLMPEPLVCNLWICVYALG